MWQSMKDFGTWYLYTARIIGVPTLFIVIVVLSQKVFNTGSCYALGYRCENSLGADEGLASYMGSMLDSNPNVDIVTKPKHR